MTHVGFGPMLDRLARLNLVDTRKHDALSRLAEVVDLGHDHCLATHAVRAEDLSDTEELVCAPWDPIRMAMTSAGKTVDDRPCKHCLSESN